MDSGFRWNDGKVAFWTFCEIINIEYSFHSMLDIGYWMLDDASES